jgi:hypothetical protein
VGLGGAGGRGLGGRGVDRREQRHRRAELHGIHRAEDPLGGPALGVGDDAGALTQPRSEHGVGEVGARLGDGGDRELAGHRAPAEARHLGEHEPHPVADLGACAQFGDGARVGAALVLRRHEALEPVRV